MAADSPKTPSVARRRLVRAVKALAFVVLLVLLGFSVRSQWGTVGHDLRRLPVGDAIAALLLSLLATALSMQAWRTVLTDLGSRLPLTPAVYIYALSQLGKYLPGSVWPVLAQMELGKAFSIPRVRMATAFLVVLLGSLVSATATGGLLVFTSPGWGRAFVLLPLVLIVMHPRLLVPLTALLGKVLRRPAVTQPPTLGGISRAMLWLVGQWVSIGIGTALMAHGLGASVSLTRVIAAVALSWAAGLAVVIVPAGAGVREGVFIFLMSSSVGSGTALTLALLGRLALTLADAAGAALGVSVARRAQRHHGIAQLEPELTES